MEHFLLNTVKLAKYYKSLGEKTFDQLEDEQLFYQFNKDSNSVAIIVNHLAGNMLSRWTNLLQEDGEKSWRNRDEEFEPVLKTKDQLIHRWNEGWDCFLGTLQTLTAADLNKTIYIRNEGHTVTDAILRQMAHYPYHVGQIVFLGKMLSGNWQSLSIPKNASKDYNQGKLSQERSNRHFTDQVSPELNTSWQILQAKQIDFEELLSFARDNFIETYAHQNNPDDFNTYLQHAFSPGAFQQEFDHPESLFFICRIEQQIVGYYKLNYGDAQTESGHPNAAEIERIYVASSYKGHGLGKTMIRHASKRAKGLDLEYLWLGVWEENPKAISFYEHLGFEQIDTHIFQVGSDAQTDVVMKLQF